jgi:hypothetical protein
VYPVCPRSARWIYLRHRVNGQPYEGNINDGAKKHIFAVTQRWLAPDGNAANGIDGFRLDVADQIGLGFWRDFRKEVRRIKPDAYLVGEIWWDTWPDQLMDPTPYTHGDVFDAVMFYQAYRPARYFFAKTDFPLDALQFKNELEHQWNRLHEDKRYAMMNVSSTHDTPASSPIFTTPINISSRPIRARTPTTAPANPTRKPTNACACTWCTCSPALVRPKFGTAKKWACGAPTTPTRANPSGGPITNSPMKPATTPSPAKRIR